MKTNGLFLDLMKRRTPAQFLPCICFLTALILVLPIDAFGRTETRDVSFYAENSFGFKVIDPTSGSPKVEVTTRDGNRYELTPEGKILKETGLDAPRMIEADPREFLRSLGFTPEKMSEEDWQAVINQFKLFEDVDTDWWPPGMPLQIRVFLLTALPELVATAVGDLTFQYPQSAEPDDTIQITVQASGTQDASDLRFEAGFDFGAKWRAIIDFVPPWPFDPIRVCAPNPLDCDAGGSLPYIPQADIAIDAYRRHTAFVLPGALPRPVTVEDNFSGIEVPIPLQELVLAALSGGVLAPLLPFIGGVVNVNPSIQMSGFGSAKLYGETLGNSSVTLDRESETQDIPYNVPTSASGTHSIPISAFSYDADCVVDLGITFTLALNVQLGPEWLRIIDFSVPAIEVPFDVLTNLPVALDFNQEQVDPLPISIEVPLLSVSPSSGLASSGTVGGPLVRTASSTR